MARPVVLHADVVGSSPPLLAVVTLAALGAAVLLGLAMGAVVRRRTGPRLLIAGALAALLGRSAVAAFSMAGSVSTTEHHLLEHGLDVVLVALVVAAVYHARAVTPEVSR